jgi:ATP-dependent Clp protease ATP-binding subunit ClpA
MKAAEQGGAAARRCSKLLRTQVGAEEIAEVVSRATGIPVSKMMQGEREKLLQMEQRLHQRVVGQDEAVRLVRMRSAARVRGWRIRTGPMARSCSSAPRAWARPSCARRWRSSCSTARSTWCAST